MRTQVARGVARGVARRAAPQGRAVRTCQSVPAEGNDDAQVRRRGLIEPVEINGARDRPDAVPVADPGQALGERRDPPVAARSVRGATLFWIAPAAPRWWVSGGDARVRAGRDGPRSRSTATIRRRLNNCSANVDREEPAGSDRCARDDRDEAMPAPRYRQRSARPRRRHRPGNASHRRIPGPADRYVAPFIHPAVPVWPASCSPLRTTVGRVVAGSQPRRAPMWTAGRRERPVDDSTSGRCRATRGQHPKSSI